MSVARYDMHGVLVEVASQDEAVGAAIDGRLRDFRTRRDGASAISYELQVTPDGVPHPVSRPGGTGRSVYEAPAGEVLYFAGEDALWIDYEDRACVLVSRARVAVSVRESAVGNVWLLSRPLFTIPLVEQLKRHGLFSVHAAAVATVGGRAVLFPGSSGAGKSTLSVALSLRGWCFMADDMVFLARRGGRLVVLGFPDEVDVTEQTAAWFPALGRLGDVPLDGWPKYRLRADETLGATVTASAIPAALVFPSVTAAEASELEALSSDRALLELAPNVLLTEASSSQAHLDALGDLARAVPSYRLTTGRDFTRVDRLLTDAVGP